MRKYAVGKSVRFANYLLDMIFLRLVAYGVGFGIGIFLAVTQNHEAIEKITKNSLGFDLVIGITFFTIYFFFMELLTGRTIGKLITQTVVVDARGEKPGPGTLFIRCLCRFIPFEPFSFLGDKRGWHDTISNTYVIRAADRQELDDVEELF
jgi:uncharacterized RDD family membrane protein YckC